MIYSNTKSSGLSAASDKEAWHAFKISYCYDFKGKPAQLKTNSAFKLTLHYYGRENLGDLKLQGHMLPVSIR